ncbi:hypothetical protein JXI42_00670 [bacterium]|nr:hypothetical protein [bacterium]
MHLSPNIWVWIAVFFTLCIYSFLYKDNPFYKFAEHVVVGVSVGYGMVMWWNLSVVQRCWVPFIEQQRYDYIFPAILGLLLIFRLSQKLSWLSRYTLGFTVGAGAGVGLPLTIQATILKQFQATVLPLNFTTWAGICNFLIILGVLSGLIYFFFSKEHKGVFGGVAQVGIWFLMIGFGATFGYTVMARLSLAIGRVLFILQDALGVNVG